MTGRHMVAGGCHCAAIRFELETDTHPSGMPVRACRCTFCTKHGARFTSDPAGAVRVVVADPGLVERYTFGHRTADFLVCRRCGAVPAILSRIGGATYAVVNINTADDPGAFAQAPVTVDFDGEARDDRLARRRKNWIGTVALSGLRYPGR